MKANWLPLSAAVALALGSVTASAVDFHGYFRAGMQANVKGGEVYCQGTGERAHKAGRLGDECDTYAELTLSQEVYNKANSKFSINTLLAYGTYEASDDFDQALSQDLQGNSWQGTGGAQNRFESHANPWGGQRISARELYAKYDTNAGYSIWAGKRYYKRKDVHILDLYYLNNSGYGAGIENIDTGIGQASFAVTKWSVNGGDIARNTWNEELIYNRRNVYKLDARLDGINVGFGSVDVDLIYALPWVSDYQKESSDSGRATNANSGVLATIEHSYAGNGLMNKFVVQYGTNGFAYVGAFKNHAGDNYTPDVGIQGVRIINWGTYDVGNFGLGYSLLWGHLNSDDEHKANDGNWTYTRSGWEYSVVLRPEYKWTEYTRTTLELGYSKMKSSDWVAATQDDPDVYKITLAQQFTPGKGFWSRPAIRFYVSYLGGKQMTKGNMTYSATDGNWTAGKLWYDNNDGNSHQVTVGTQVEAWW